MEVHEYDVWVDKALVLYLPPPYRQISISKRYDHGSDCEN